MMDNLEAVRQVNERYGTRFLSPTALRELLEMLMPCLENFDETEEEQTEHIKAVLEFHDVDPEWNNWFLLLAFSIVYDGASVERDAVASGIVLR